MLFNVGFLENANIYSARIKLGDQALTAWRWGLNVEVVRDVARSVLSNTLQRLVAIYRPTQKTSHTTPTKLSVLVDLQTSASYKYSRFSVLLKWALAAHNVY